MAAPEGQQAAHQLPRPDGKSFGSPTARLGDVANSHARMAPLSSEAPYSKAAHLPAARATAKNRRGP